MESQTGFRETTLKPMTLLADKIPCLGPLDELTM